MRQSAVLALLGLACSLGTATADPITFIGTSADGTLQSQRTHFQQSAQLNGATLNFEGFNSYFPGDDPSAYFALQGHGLLEVTENSVSRHVVSVDSDTYVTEGTRAIRMSINNPSEYVFHFSEDTNVFGIDISDVDADAGTISIIDNLGNSLLSFSTDSNSPIDVFFGLVNDEAYDTVTIMASGNPNRSFGGFVGFDNLQFGVAPNVLHSPEPGSVAVWSVLAAVVAGSACYGRRRR